MRQYGCKAYLIAHFNHHAWSPTLWWKAWLSGWSWMAHGCMARQKQDKLEVRMWIVFQDRSYCPGTQRHKLPVAVHGWVPKHPKVFALQLLSTRCSTFSGWTCILSSVQRWMWPVTLCKSGKSTVVKCSSVQGHLWPVAVHRNLIY